MDDQPIRPLVPRPKGLLPPSYPSTPITLVASPTAPHSILKVSSESPSPSIPIPNSSSTSSSSTSSTGRSSPTKSHRQNIAEHGAYRRTPGSKAKEGAFFAFVLLPLSCWYTRGGKRLGEMEDLDSEPFRPRPSQQLQRRRSVSVVPAGGQLVRRNSVSVGRPMQSPGGRW